MDYTHTYLPELRLKRSDGGCVVFVDDKKIGWMTESAVDVLEKLVAIYSIPFGKEKEHETN